MNREQWELAHKACPKCGSTGTKQTLVGIVEVIGEDYEDNLNTAECTTCGWAGMVRDLVPENGAAGEDQKPMPIRTLDFQGETYVNTKDVVTAMLDFNERLKKSINRPDVHGFSDAVFKELTDMMVTVDKGHWVNKYNYQAKLGEEMKKKAKDDFDGVSAEPEGEK